jgi:hypothetical protein
MRRIKQLLNFRGLGNFVIRENIQIGKNIINYSLVAFLMTDLISEAI